MTHARGTRLFYVANGHGPGTARAGRLHRGDAGPLRLRDGARRQALARSALQVSRRARTAGSRVGRPEPGSARWHRGRTSSSSTTERSRARLGGLAPLERGRELEARPAGRTVLVHRPDERSTGCATATWAFPTRR